MKEENKIDKDYRIKKWMFYFSIAVATIIIYKLLDNYTYITAWIGKLFKVLEPFIGGILLSYILYLPCKKFEKIYEKRKNKFASKHARALSITTVYIIAMIILVILFNIILPILIHSLSDLVNNIPEYYETASNKIMELPEDNILRSETASNILNRIKSIDLTKLLNPDKILEYVKGLISAVNTIFNAFIAIVVSIYILSQRRQIVGFWSRLSHAMLTEKAYCKVKKYFRNGNEIFFKFLTSQILDAILVGVIISIAMLILRVKYAVLLGFMIGLFNLIPFFGAIIAVVIAIVITLLTGGIWKTLLMAIIIIILQQIDANIINPKIVGSSLNISQIVVIFAVTIGGAYYGILGMFLAVPIITIIKMIIEDYIQDKESKKISNI